MSKKMSKKVEKIKIKRIVYALAILLPLYSSGEPRGDIALKEAMEAREAAERRTIELEAEVSHLKKDLEESRDRYAKLYAESHSVIERLRLMELRAAQLLCQKEDAGLTSESAVAFEALENAGRKQISVQRRLVEFEQSLATMLEVLQPSDAMRGELVERLQRVKDAVEESLKAVSVVAGRGTNEAAPQGCSVVAVHEELEVVLLDRGSSSGVRVGSRFSLKRGDKTMATVKVIDVRSGLSAGVLVEGKLSAVAVGSVMLPEAMDIQPPGR